MASDPDPTPPLLVSDHDGVRTLMLNRPQAYNSLNAALKDRLLAGLQETAADDTIRTAVLTGRGKAFCAGQDLKEHARGLLSEDDPLSTVADHYIPIATAIAEMPKPVIAAINGPTAGAGAAFAYAADVRIAARSANFSLAFANVGLGPDAGASWTLQRLVGYGRALELMLCGRKVDASEALQMGMVTEVVEDGKVLSRAQEVAATFARGPSLAYREIKRALSTAAGSTFSEALSIEHLAQMELGRTSDHREAVEAFLNGRVPAFTGS